MRIQSHILLYPKMRDRWASLRAWQMRGMQVLYDTIHIPNTLFGIYPAGDNSVSTANLQLNGNDRFAKKNGEYFSLVNHRNITQIYQVMLV